MNCFATSGYLKETDYAGLELHISILYYVALHTLPGVDSNILTIKTNAVYCLFRTLLLDQSLVENLHHVAKSIGQHLVTVRVVRHSTNCSCMYET